MRSDFTKWLESRVFGAGLRNRPSAAFTLVELLVVVAILALLAGLLFPVFNTVRGKGRQVACLSNLRQIGMAVQMYAQDYDSMVPFAKDASDAYVPSMWESEPACKNMLSAMPFLHPVPPKIPAVGQSDVLGPYLRNSEIWRCPSDSGFDYLDHNDSCGGPCPLSARPTMFEAFGSSFLYRTELAFRRSSLDTLSGMAPDGRQVGPSGVHLLFDGNGGWHGTRLPWSKQGLRYNAVFADGHAASLDWDRYWQVWGVQLSDGQSPLPCP